MSGTVGATTLTAAQMPEHEHKDADLWGSSGYKKNIRYMNSDIDTGKSSPDRYTDTAGGSQAHTHSLSGSSGSANSLPPYYALAYIMRLS